MDKVLPDDYRAVRALAMGVIEGRGDLIEAARQVARGLNEAGIPCAVIGGIAVVLHGHPRTTRDIDLLVNRPLEPVAEYLVSLGFELDADRREFRRGEIVVQLVTPDLTEVAPDHRIEIDGVVTVRLGDLVAMKLRSGQARVTRAQDLADVIGLIRAQSLDGSFAARLPADLRGAFLRLVRAVRDEG